MLFNPPAKPLLLRSLMVLALATVSTVNSNFVHATTPASTAGGASRCMGKLATFQTLITTVRSSVLLMFCPLALAEQLIICSPTRGRHAMACGLKASQWKTCRLPRKYC